jgi:DNA-binding CsgD family transcriptional regulator
MAAAAAGNAQQMELSPTDQRLKSIGNIDLFTTDQKYNFKLTDILRKRQRPLLLLLDRDGQLLFSSIPSPESDGTKPADNVFTQAFLNDALLETQRLFRQPQQQPVSAIVEQLTINKPGERCALIILGNGFYCLRLFSLQNGSGERGDTFAALIEVISKPKHEHIDINKAKGLFRLSNREVDVLKALVSGGTDKEIAIQLAVSVETVRAYLKSIRAKLGAKTRTAIVSIVHGLQAEAAAAAAAMSNDHV